MGWRAVATGAAVRALLASLALCALAPGVASAATTIVFDVAPAPQTNQTTATFKWHDIATASGYTCQLDTTGATACSPSTNLPFSGLSEGNHTFTVQPQGGTTAIPPTTYKWTVDLTPPATQITGKPAGTEQRRRRSTFTFTSPDADRHLPLHSQRRRGGALHVTAHLHGAVRRHPFPAHPGR